MSLGLTVTLDAADMYFSTVDPADANNKGLIYDARHAARCISDTLLDNYSQTTRQSLNNRYDPRHTATGGPPNQE